MPIDAVFLESLRCELQEQLLACRVDKVQQPERDTILLSLLYFIYKVSIPQKSPFEKRILKFLLNPP